MSDPHDAGAQSFTAMSLRDYFAAQAMKAIVTTGQYASDEDGEFVARYAYEMANAMLIERASREKAAAAQALADLHARNAERAKDAEAQT